MAEYLEQLEAASRSSLATYDLREPAILLGGLMLPRLAESVGINLEPRASGATRLDELEDYFHKTDGELLQVLDTELAERFVAASGLTKSHCRSLWDVNQKPGEFDHRMITSGHIATYDYIMDTPRWLRTTKVISVLATANDDVERGVPARDLGGDEFDDKEYIGRYVLPRLFETKVKDPQQFIDYVDLTRAQETWPKAFFKDCDDMLTDNMVTVGVAGEPIIQAIKLRRAAVEIDGVGVDEPSIPQFFFETLPIPVATKEAELDMPGFVSPYYALRTIITASRLLVEERFLR